MSDLAEIQDMYVDNTFFEAKWLPDTETQRDTGFGLSVKSVCRQPISRVLSATVTCRGRSFFYDADCSTPPAADPKVGRSGPNRVCPKTHSLLLSLAPNEVYPADSVA